MDALIVVDVQNDFCPGGALAVKDGDAVIEPINRLERGVDYVVGGRDWHPSDHRSFREHGGPWPVHCVQGTWGAEFRAGLDTERFDVIVNSGEDRDAPGYSEFEGTDLEQLLRERGIDRVHVAGLTLDYCVKHTALDAARLGFDTVVHVDATRAVNVKPGDDRRAVDELRAAGVELEGQLAESAPTGAP